MRSSSPTNIASRRRAILPAAAAALLLPTLARAQSAGADTCTHRLPHVPDPGWQGKLVDVICPAQDSGCDYEDIVFNNALETEHCGAVDIDRKYIDCRIPRTMPRHEARRQRLLAGRAHV
ncbi:hypothetical protein F5X96DRAFT_633138 [Biscogniauxia mediterranea]|nr:hypothetical protein F5X96DRAFT_633138 [Biscogniauxia mediterranea]